MTVRRIVLCLFALLALSCSSEVTRTQLTFQITAGPSVRESIQTLRVTVRNNEDQMKTFDAEDLTWPVEIVVLPEAGNSSTDTITLLVSAYGAAGLLAEQTTRAAFEPERVRVVPVGLGGDAVLPADDGGKPDPERDAGKDLERDAGGKEEVDASEPVVNCSTDKKIKCDDGNLCNGVETCDPKSSSADMKGCVPSANPVTCSKDMTCDSSNGECSTCLAKPDGDGDGVNSIACGGLDCNDNDKDVAPKKAEKCNNRDDDCDGTRDGTAADADCKAVAPKGGSASCVSGACVGACTDPTYQIENGVCVKPPMGCPENACAPGKCVAGSPNYVCICPSTHHAGVGATRCAPTGVPTRTLGFEKNCDGMDIPSPVPASEIIPIAATQFAACGVNSITASTTLAVAPTLVRPLAMSTTVIAGLTTPTALEIPQGMVTGATSVLAALTIGLSQPVTELSFNLLDVDNLPGLKIVLQSGAKVIDVTPLLTAGTKTVAVKHPASAASAAPIDQVVITYAPAPPTALVPVDRLFLDDLSYRVGGCGDKVIEGIETCDDGNLVQCDGCDNACALTTASCSI